MRGTTSVFFAAAVGAALACGGSSSAPAPASQGAGFTITISGMSFSPLALRVPPGTTVTVVNRDPDAHSVTSEARPNAFVRGSVGGVAFDTGEFTGTRTFTIPANAPDGTTIPYFCTAHLSTMVTPNGVITVDASAQAAPAPAAPPMDGGGGGGGY